MMPIDEEKPASHKDYPETWEVVVNEAPNLDLYIRILTSSRALKGGDFCRQRRTFTPDTEGVQSSVDIAIVRRPAIGTNPMSYSKRAHTFRTAGGNYSAARARLGSPSFIGLDIYPAPHGELVPEHRAERRPRCIENGLRHPRSRQGLGVHIADDDQLVELHEPRRLFVQMVTPLIDGAGLDRLDAALVAGPLCCGERAFVLTVVAQSRDLVTIAARRERCQAEINAEFPRIPSFGFSYLDLKVEIPAAARIGGEIAAVDGGRINVPAVPETIAALQVNRGIIFDLDGAGGGERYPAKRFLAAPARAPARGVAARYELFADRLNGVAVQAEHGTAAGREVDQIEGRGPALIQSPRRFLDLAAIVPHSVDGTSMRGQPVACGGVLDPVSVRQQHHAHIIGLWAIRKTSDTEDIAFR